LHGQVRYGVVSRFVDEIPAELCKWIVLPEKQATFGSYQPGRQGSFFNSGSNYGGSSSKNYAQQNAADYGREGAPDISRAGFETKRPDEHPFAVGQNVQHTKFGEGVVVNFEGRGLDARVQVKFRSEGVKWLALQYAKLVAA
jgi:DNA helicase II / ATP-dependent DNA helicase PcrA